MSADPVEDIADALVTFLEGAPNWTPPASMNFVVEKNATPEEKLYKEKQKTLIAFVVPFGETAQKIGRGGEALEVYQVYVVISRELNADFTRQNLSLFAREVKLAIRKNRRMAGCVWSGDQTDQKYNATLLMDHNTFVCSMRFDFAKAA